MSTAPTALVLGATGRIGAACLAGDRDIRWLAAPRSVDIRDPAGLDRALAAARPAWVVNCAAFTDVARAEKEPALAYAVNATGATHVARACARAGCRLVHLSTDFVFDGDKSGPYTEQDAPRPVNVYGESKLEGERGVLAAGAEAIVLRVSWIFSGTRDDFVVRILRTLRESGEARVVADQVGGPTSARSVARAIATLVRRAPVAAVVHYANEPVATRFEFAREICARAQARGLLPTSAVVQPTVTDASATPRRPANSAFDLTRARALELPIPEWRDELDAILP